jgi:putative membrane protein
VTLLGYLLWQHGAGVGRALGAVGWLLVPIVLIHVGQLWLSGAAWHAVAITAEPLPCATYVWTRWIREAVGGLLPMAQIGGEVVGGRLLVLAGASPAEAAASITVDLTLEALTLVVFIALGVGCAWLTGSAPGLIGYTLLGLCVLGPAVLALWMLQRLRVEGQVVAWCARLTRRWPRLRVQGLEDFCHAIQASHRHPGALARGFAYHLLGWLGGVIEIYVMAQAIGLPILLEQALIIESLGQAIRSAAFFVPAGLGVQEGSLLLLAAALGLPAATGLALSLVKRLREVVLGLPALLAWQLIESGRWARFRHRGATPPSA